MEHRLQAPGGPSRARRTALSAWGPTACAHSRRPRARPSPRLLRAPSSTVAVHKAAAAAAAAAAASTAAGSSSDFDGATCIPNLLILSLAQPGLAVAPAVQPAVATAVATAVARSSGTQQWHPAVAPAVAPAASGSGSSDYDGATRIPNLIILTLGTTSGTTSGTTNGTTNGTTPVQLQFCFLAASLVYEPRIGS